MFRTAKYLAVGLLVVIIAVSLVSDVVQMPLKRLALEKATLSGPVTWSDVLCARSVVRTNEMNGKIVHIGKTVEKRERTMVLFTARYMCEMSYDPVGKWRVISKCIYML
jgi:hypothetical protein